MRRAHLPPTAGLHGSACSGSAARCRLRPDRIRSISPSQHQHRRTHRSPGHQALLALLALRHCWHPGPLVGTPHQRRPGGLDCNCAAGWHTTHRTPAYNAPHMRRASLRLGSLATHLQQPAAAAMSRRGTARTMARAAGEPVPVAAAPAPPLGPAAFSLVGRRAIVTGATKGIGAATAVALARAGADVAVLGRDVAGLAATAAAVRAEGRDAWPIKADFATADGTVTLEHERTTVPCVS